MYFEHYLFCVQVVFVGEGVDTGGLTREFFRLICYSIRNRYLESTGCFRHNATAYQVYIHAAKSSQLYQLRMYKKLVTF